LVALLSEVAEDLRYRLVMKIIPERVVRLQHILLIDLPLAHALQPPAILLTQVPRQQHIILLHRVLIIPLRITIEIILTLTWGVLDLSEGEGDSTGSVFEVVVDVVEFAAGDGVEPGVTCLAGEDDH